jgi:inner membrane protein
MSNSATHGLAAFTTVTVLSAVDERHRGQATLRPLLDGAAGALLTSLPDKLEPAIHPNHRQFFHSVVFAAGVGYATYQAYKWQPTNDWEQILRWLVIIGGVAYLTHLALDACTAKSLPLVGKL